VAKLPKNGKLSVRKRRKVATKHNQRQCQLSLVIIEWMGFAPSALSPTPKSSQSEPGPDPGVVRGTPPHAEIPARQERNGLIPAPSTGEDATTALRQLVLNAVTSAHTRRNYAKALDELFALCAERRQGISRASLLEYRAGMVDRGLAPSTINVRLSAIRKLVDEARRNGILDPEEAARLTDIPNVRQQGTRLGNWLTRAQTRELLAVPDRSTLKGKRDYCILALLVGCALRRTELANLKVELIQLREGRWVLADLRGKGGRIRTVAVPLWVKQGIDAWREAAPIGSGYLLRPLTKSGSLRGEHLDGWAIWQVVGSSAKEIGIERFGAHDLRRTCAKLCRRAGGDLEQIKFLLGHASIQTTERYLGSEQEIAVAVNDSLGL
jgi:integrase